MDQSLKRNAINARPQNSQNSVNFGDRLLNLGFREIIEAILKPYQ
jgi:hypothetical protein